MEAFQVASKQRCPDMFGCCSHEYDKVAARPAHNAMPIATKGAREREGKKVFRWRSCKRVHLAPSCQPAFRWITCTDLWRRHLVNQRQVIV